MPLNAAPAFPDEPGRFPDGRDAEARTKERTEIEKQIAHLTDFPNDQRRQRKVLNRLARGRDERGVPPFAELRNRNVPALALQEFLVTTADLRRGDVRELIDDAELSRVRVSVLGGALTRLVPRRPVQFPALVDATKRLPITPNYLVAQGGWTKGEGGPEPTAARPQWQPGDRRIQVAVVDTGLGARSDEWLQGLTNPEVDPLYPAPPDPTLGLAAGHGTFAAGIVQRVEPSVDLRIYRGLDIDGLGSDVVVGAKIEQAAANGAVIVNLSLGTQTVGDEQPPGMLAGIRRAIEINPNILIVCSAGNYGDTRKVWPGAFSLTFPDNVVAVAGLNAQGEAAPWSTHDDVTLPADHPDNFVRISTIAEGIVSTYVDGTEDVVVEDPPDTFKLNDWACWTGTSFGAPQVAGAVASICLADAVVPTEAITRLRSQGTPIPGYGAAVRILPGT